MVPAMWELPAFGLAFVAMCLGAWLGERRALRRDDGARSASPFTRFLLGFSVLWTLVVLGGAISRRAAEGPAGAPSSMRAGGLWIVLPLLPVVWLAASAVVSRLGGWRSLARRFGANDAPRGAVFLNQTVGLAPLVAYRACIHLTVASSGLHLEPMVLLRFMHPPLSVPWSQVASCARNDGVFAKRVTLTFGDGAGRIRIAGEAAPAIEAAWRAAGGAGGV